jgi:RNA polymerase sigma-70 factor (ECF subfamily)
VNAKSTASFDGVPRVEVATPDRTASTVSRGELADADLVHDVAMGDHDALAEVYERHGANVLSLAQHVCGPRDADDVVQEVFMRLWREPQAFDAHRGSLCSFLLVITRFRSIDLIRSNSARQRREEKFVTNAEPERQELDIDLMAQEQRARIAEAVNGLRDDVRDAICVAFYGRYTYVEVAAVLGVPEGTVKARIRAGLRELRGPLSDLLVADEP